MKDIFEVPSPDKDLLEKANKVRTASIKISQKINIERVKALNSMADHLEKHTKKIIDANSEDYKKAEKFIEKNNNLERDDQDFEFNQDIDNDNENFRSPGWIRYQKRLK